MALSTGGLTGSILVIILLHVALLVPYYFSVMKNPSKAQNLTIDEKYHDRFRWSILGLISLSWLFSVATTAACTFLKINIKGTDTWVGMNAFEHPTDGCTRFSKQIDARNNPAFTFAVFNCVLSFVGVFGMMLMQFVLTMGRKRTWLALRIFMYISLWCCMLTFYIQETDTCDVYDCSLGGAGIAQIFNVIWLVAACILMFVTPHGDDTGIKTIQKQRALEDDDLNLEDNMTAIDMSGTLAPRGPAGPFETETHLPDGSVQRQVETTNPDGTKTVMTTIEHPTDGGDKGDVELMVNISDDVSVDEEQPSIS